MSSLSLVLYEKLMLTLKMTTHLKYLLGHISQGSQFKAVAISRSPLGHGRCSALLKVDDASPASLEIVERFVPCFFNAAIISAGCQSSFIIIPYFPLNLVIQGAMFILSLQFDIFIFLQLFP